MLYCNKGYIEILTNMRKTLTILASALLLAGAATSCASLDKMAEMAEKVKVTCNPEILRKREQTRGDRCPGSAESSAAYLYPKEGYDLVLDTGTRSPSENALYIFNKIFSNP